MPAWGWEPCYCCLHLSASSILGIWPSSSQGSCSKWVTTHCHHHRRHHCCCYCHCHHHHYRCCCHCHHHYHHLIINIIVTTTTIIIIIIVVVIIIIIITIIIIIIITTTITIVISLFNSEFGLEVFLEECYSVVYMLQAKCVIRHFMEWLRISVTLWND